MSKADGRANDGWFVRLKKSARNRRLFRSVSLNSFPIVKSMFFCDGPMKQLRGTFPRPVASPGEPSASGITASGTNAFGFSQLAKHVLLSVIVGFVSVWLGVITGRSIS